MEIQIELLKLKELNPLQKLIIGLILSSPAELKLAGGHYNTSGDIGKLLGESRTIILREIGVLLELGYITSRKGRGWRITNITQKLKDLL
jgi:biotin operon repressor